MRTALQRAWLRRGLLARLLWPVSLLFGALAALRRRWFRNRLLRTYRAPVPVVVVGNVVVGGAGKTPVVMALVHHWVSQGLRVGVVSRGYGRQGTDCQEVHPDTQASDVGDEPLLIASRCQVPVFVARRRPEAVSALLAAHPGVQLIVSDDGLQHYALARDLEICVFDERGIGNGWLLPAGPLREPWPRRADLVLRTAGTPGLGGFEIRRSLAAFACRADGTRAALADLEDQPCKAVAGIARPEAFFSMLRAAGLQLAETQALADHHDFGSEPPALQPGWHLLCTEKDAVKLWRHQPQAWAVPLQLDIDAGFWIALDSMLAPKLSSAT